MKSINSDSYSEVEGNKLLYDYLKHITTLCTGSILILATFLEKLFLNAVWKQLIAWTFIFLILALVISLLTMILAANRVYDEPEEKLEKIMLILFVITIITFVIGIILLSIFSIKNF